MPSLKQNSQFGTVYKEKISPMSQFAPPEIWNAEHLCKDFRVFGYQSEDSAVDSEREESTSYYEDTPAQKLYSYRSD